MNAIVATRHLEDCKRLLKQAQDNAQFTRNTFEDLIGKQSLGQEVSDSAISKARKERDAAVAALEAAEIGLKAAAQNAVQAQEVARAEAEADDWKAVVELGARYQAAVREMEDMTKQFDKAASSLFEIAAQIEQRSPRARQRPDVSDLAGARLRARLQRSLELSMPTIYGASSEARYNFQGFCKTMTTSLAFYTDKVHGGV